MRVLILAGQHGDEQPARRTLGSLLALPPKEAANRFPATRMAVVPEANPDGCARCSRCNAEGVDLNRDHQLLLSSETSAIHRFVRRWQPHVILDLHSFPSRRRHLLARNIVLDHDVFIDAPTHPAILARTGNVEAAEILQRLLQAIKEQTVRADRYTLIAASGRARHSTPDVVDARNGLALRYGAFTILVENRQPRRDETPLERFRLRAAQERALWAVLGWLDKNHGLFASAAPATPPAPGSPVPIHFKYADALNGFRLVGRHVDRAGPGCVTFPRYSASLTVRRTVALPAGYAVPAEMEKLTAVLRRHGFVSVPIRNGKSYAVEQLQIKRARPSRRPNRPAKKVVVAPRRLRLELDRYEIFPTRQRGGHALAVFLEPESKHGLHRFADLRIPLTAPSWYPILRVWPREEGLGSG